MGVRVLPERSQRRREELMVQLTDLYLAEGFTRHSVGQLAERLNCSRSTLYLVAPSKEQIITAVVRNFFRRAAGRIEDRVAAEAGPAERLRTFLLAVATELRPATGAFYADVAGFAPANDLYRENTARAAQRFQDLVTDGVSQGVLREVDAGFVGAAAAEVMGAIQEGRIEAATGLDDASVYQALADLFINGLVKHG